MEEILRIITLTGLAGACIPLGAALAMLPGVRPRWLKHELRHFITALGGGILLGAVSEVLVPEGLAAMDESMLAIPIVFTGALVFFAIERFLGLRRQEAPQLMGMLLDYVPEAIALGGMVAASSPLSLLLAVLIGVQNLPEGFNAYRELEMRNHGGSRRGLRMMLMLVPLGPIAGLCGYFFLSGHEAVLGAIMLFAAGGIIYLIFQDIAPQSRLKKHWAPPLGAVCGFCLALFSEMLVNPV
ncbi:MAG: divalent cation transporter [Halieaceae bacterium]|jgi:ZIP family zinc transporter|nr:divalent cation transporter [Halieaceae bacterium]